MYDRTNIEVDRAHSLAAISAVKDDSSYYVTKRIMDLVISLLALIFLAPIIFLIALLIKLDSAGPAFFRQTRVGVKRRTLDGHAYWNKTHFTCLKFRTMYQDNDQSLHQNYIKAFVHNDLQSMEAIQGCKTSTCKLIHDPRISRIGKFLRKTSLDELPQLFNILRGEMSLVGPRPDVPYAVKHYKSWHFERLATLPGLTGLWQTTGRGNVIFDEMVRMDIEYIHNQSNLLDLKLLILTIPAVLSRRGAE